MWMAYNHLCKKAFVLSADRFAAFIWRFIAWQVYIHECSFYHEHAWGMIFWDCYLVISVLKNIFKRRLILIKRWTVA